MNKLRQAFGCLLRSSVLMLAAFPSTAASLRIVTWNMNNLHQQVGLPLRPGAPIRSEKDYQILRKYSEQLHADVYVLQEVYGPRAARRVFPKARFDLYFSGRYVNDLVTGQDSDHIYTGFAVRRTRFDAVTKLDYADLSVVHSDGHPVRWGTDILLEQGEKRLRIMSVHLKSGCAEGSLINAKDPDCVTLAKQVPPLEHWIDLRAAERVPFILAGDFNRAFDKFGASDHFWREIDDAQPAGLDLRRLPSDKSQTCWQGTPLHHQYPIDFFVFDQRSWALVRADSLVTMDYAAEDRDLSRKTPSDHCPVAIELEF